MKAYRMLAVLFVMVGLGLSACQNLPGPSAVPPTAFVPAEPASVPNGTVLPVVAASIPDLDKGQVAWKEAKCAACHGPLALGGIGPAIAATRLSYDEFIRVVRTAHPPKPAFDQATLPEPVVYNIYAWVRTQLPAAQVAASAAITATSALPRPEEMMAMTLWTCKKCTTCHGVFAQGSASAPTLAGLNDPLADELAQMRSTSATIPEHGVDNVSDDLFGTIYQWLKRGCLSNECSQ
jgi:mono/diheme cytochrome c family protein